MQRYIKWFVFVMTAVVLVGCGGSSTAAVVDTALEVKTYSPADDTIDANAENDLIMTFDAYISKVAGKQFKIFKTDGDIEHTSFDVGVAQVLVNGDMATINPNKHLVYGSAHYVKIDSGAFKDATGHNYSGIANTTSWNFAVPSGSGPCGLDCVDNCDLPVELQ
jgi:hypothetical protein